MESLLPIKVCTLILEKGSSGGKMKIEARERFAQVIIELRAGRSYRSFAMLVEVSHPTIKAWENMERVPDLENLEKVAQMRGQSLDEFRRWLENEPTPLQKLINEIKVIPSKDLPEILKIIAQRLENN